VVIEPANLSEPVQQTIGVPRVPSPRIFRVLHVIKPGPFDAASMRYRSHNVLEALGQLGIEATFLDIEQLPQQLGWALGHDLIVLTRRPCDPNIRLLLEHAEKAQVPVVFDIDDYVFDTEVISYLSYLKGFETYILGYRQTLDRCAYFTGATPNLVERARALGKKSYWIRNGLNSVQLELARQVLQRKAPRQPGQRIRIGYFSGSSCHQGDFRIVAEVLVRLLQEHPELDLVLAGWLDLAEFPELERFQGRLECPSFMDWRDLTGLIASVDINIIPLQSNPIYAGKSDLKYYEAALVKVPSIASPNPILQQSIRSGHNGLLASDVEEWYQGLKRLLTDAAYRQELAENAHRHALETYVPAAVGRQALAAYQSILTEHRKQLGVPLDRPTVVVLLSDPQQALRLGAPALDLAPGLVGEGAHVTVQVPVCKEALPKSAREAADLLEPMVGIESVAISVGRDIPCCDLLIATDAETAFLAAALRRRARHVRYLAATHEARQGSGDGSRDARIQASFELGLPILALDAVQGEFLRRRHGAQVEVLPGWNRSCAATPPANHSPDTILCHLDPSLSPLLAEQVGQALQLFRRRHPQFQLVMSGELDLLKHSTELQRASPVPLPRFQPGLRGRPVCLFPCSVAPSRLLHDCQAAGATVLVTSELPTWQEQATASGALWVPPYTETILEALDGIFVGIVRWTAQMLEGWSRARARLEPRDVARQLLTQALDTARPVLPLIAGCAA
jgi:glycosyltransferase involved in cell wall biosynthesis